MTHDIFFIAEDANKITIQRFIKFLKQNFKLKPLADGHDISIREHK
jgi:hypothetical protein